MRISIRDANVLAKSGHSTCCDLHLDATTISFDDGGDVYTLEEIRLVMRNRRRDHTRKLDEGDPS
jgi:hypothetical protein